MLLRANALAKGYSGARVETVELLLECLDRGVLPRRAEPRLGRRERRPRAARASRAAARRRGGGMGRRRAAPGRAKRSQRAGLEPIALAGEGRPLARQRHAVHGRVRRARPHARTPAREGGRHRVRACRSRRCRARATSFLPQIHALRPLRGQQDSAANVLRPARGLGDQRVAPLVRQGAGRLLAALRAAGARRDARPARLRRLHGLGRAQRGDRQPARPRRGRAARLERELPRAAGRVRARRARDGGRRAREHLGAAGRAARQSEPVRRAAAVPHRRRRAQLGVHDPAVRGRVARQREQGARPPGERRLDPDERRARRTTSRWGTPPA